MSKPSPLWSQTHRQTRPAAAVVVTAWAAAALASHCRRRRWAGYRQEPTLDDERYDFRNQSYSIGNSSQSLYHRRQNEMQRPDVEKCFLGETSTGVGRFEGNLDGERLRLDLRENAPAPSRIAVVVVVVGLCPGATPRESYRATGDQDAIDREDRFLSNQNIAAPGAAVSYSEADEAGEEEELRRGRDCS